MKVNHVITLDSDYEFVEVEPKSENVETWTYLVYTDKENDTAIELQFDINHEPTFEVGNITATTVMYGQSITPCPFCQTKEMEICPEYEAEKQGYEKDHAFLHECGFDEDELLLFAMELYIHDHFEEIVEQEDFDEAFILEEKRGRSVVFYETNAGIRFLLRKNDVFHVLKQGEELVECPFCELNELALYGEEEAHMKCAVLTRNVPYLRQLIANHPEQSSGS